MPTEKDRIQTIVAIINGHPSLTAANINKLKAEFHEVISVHEVSKIRRRHILKILHSTRALDSTLKAILDHHRIRGGAHSLGQYLFQFRNHNSAGVSKLTNSERAKYQDSIVKVRNEHLHNADSYPKNDRKVLELIAEMHALMMRVTTL